MMSDPQEQQNFQQLNHLAIIMDGNGRWAKQRHLPRIAGHRQGVETVNQIVDECIRQQIACLSLFAFSSENWGRPSDEIDALMTLLLQYLDSQRKKMLEQGIRLRVIGNLERMKPEVRTALARAEQATAEGQVLTLVLALSYGGRDEIVRAARRIAEQAEQGTLDPRQLDTRTFAGFLDTADLPAPDLLIRTSGEMRVSNFLLWQLAYAELYFTDILWPDFDAVALRQALDDYRRRQRRFGLTDAQMGRKPSLSTAGE
jgi:undecaprenyl diphosphate synthase